jgi:hypothetical protein
MGEHPLSEPGSYGAVPAGCAFAIKGRTQSELVAAGIEPFILEGAPDRLSHAFGDLNSPARFGFTNREVLSRISCRDRIRAELFCIP